MRENGEKGFGFFIGKIPSPWILGF